MTRTRHRREGMYRTLVSDATQARTSLRCALAPGPEEWPSQHGICLDIGRTSCQLRTVHNPAFTFQQSTIVVCLGLTRLEMGKTVDSRSDEKDSQVLSGHQCYLGLRHYSRQYLWTETPNNTDPHRRQHQQVHTSLQVHAEILLSARAPRLGA